MTSSFNALLFDIDNVLVDTRASYLTAIQKTVELYLDRPGVVSLKEIDQFKLLGGFNDDWDACFGIITFLETAIQGKPIRFGDHRRQRLSRLFGCASRSECPQCPRLFCICLRPDRIFVSRAVGASVPSQLTHVVMDVGVCSLPLNSS